MNAKVIDTNVLIVANGKSVQASLECCLRCIETLQEATRQLVVIDDAFYILKEYMKEVNPSGQPGAGDEFLRWILRNQGTPTSCEIVTLTPNTRNSFQEFPNDLNLADFDASDHKFVAVANASINAPIISNAVDSDWWIHDEILKRNGIQVMYICEEQVALWKISKTQK